MNSNRGSKRSERRFRRQKWKKERSGYNIENSQSRSYFQNEDSFLEEEFKDDGDRVFEEDDEHFTYNKNMSGSVHRLGTNNNNYPNNQKSQFGRRSTAMKNKGDDAPTDGGVSSAACMKGSSRAISNNLNMALLNTKMHNTAIANYGSGEEPYSRKPSDSRTIDQRTGGDHTDDKDHQITLQNVELMGDESHNKKLETSHRPSILVEPLPRDRSIGQQN